MRFIQLIIRGYQLFLVSVVHSIVPVQGGCRFHPTCSEYAKNSFQQHSFFSACWLTLKRLCRCHPWGASGFDPVPDQSLKTSCHSHFNR